MQKTLFHQETIRSGALRALRTWQKIAIGIVLLVMVAYTLRPRKNGESNQAAIREQGSQIESATFELGGAQRADGHAGENGRRAIPQWEFLTGNPGWSPIDRGIGELVPDIQYVLGLSESQVEALRGAVSELATANSIFADTTAVSGLSLPRWYFVLPPAKDDYWVPVETAFKSKVYSTLGARLGNLFLERSDEALAFMTGEFGKAGRILLFNTDPDAWRRNPTKDDAPFELVIGMGGAPIFAVDQAKLAEANPDINITELLSSFYDERTKPREVFVRFTEGPGFLSSLIEKRPR